MTRWSHNNHPGKEMAPRETFKNLETDKQQRVLDTAIEEFACHGFRQASVNRMVQKLGIAPDTSTLSPDLLFGSLVERTYHRNGLQRVPMPQGIGHCVLLNNVSKEEIENAVKKIYEWLPQV